MTGLRWAPTWALALGPALAYALLAAAEGQDFLAGRPGGVPDELVGTRFVAALAAPLPVAVVAWPQRWRLVLLVPALVPAAFGAVAAVLAVWLGLFATAE